MKDLSLKQEALLKYSYNDYHLRAAKELQKLKLLPFEVHLRKSSIGSQRPPERTIDYYIVGSGILFKCLENPLSVNKLSKRNCRMKGSKSRPPQRRPRIKSFLKYYIKYFLELEFIHKNERGFYVSPKGKEFIREVLR